MNRGWKTGPGAIRYEDRLFILILLGGLAPVACCIILLWLGNYEEALRWTLAPLLVGIWLFAASAARRKVVHPLRTLGSLLAGLREGDYSTRARGGRPDDALGGLFSEANTLSRTLSEQRRAAVEASALLRTVMSEIEVSVFAFDSDHRLRLVNRAGESLMDAPAQALVGRTAEELALGELLDNTEPIVLERSFPRGAGRWGVRVSTFWERGLPHRLLVVQDLTRALREEQLQAWKRLVRVIGHELNNSLTPIKSIAGSLRTLLGRHPAPADWREDADQGLAVIAGRAEALARFMGAYALLAKLPAPRLERMNVAGWIHRVIQLERRLPVRLVEGPDLTVRGDGDQLDQLLINIVRNAADAALETQGSVDVSWKRTSNRLEIRVEDSGPGLADSANLFVPFFTTKPGGSGIGLALSRQIAESHGGELSLENRPDGTGCRVTIRLPL